MMAEQIISVLEEFKNEIQKLDSGQVYNSIMIHPALWNIVKRKIKRGLSYEVSYWDKNERKTKWFHSVRRARKFANQLHTMNVDMIEIEKFWGYRNHSPRHKWYYVSPRPNKFICIERY